MPELIIGSFSAPSGIGTPSSISSAKNWEKAEQVNIDVRSNINNGAVVDCSVTISHGITNSVDFTTKLITDGDLSPLTILVKTQNIGLLPFDTFTSLNIPNDLESIESSAGFYYKNISPKHDVGFDHEYYAVHVLNEKPKPPADYKYYPTTDFVITAELIGFTTNFVEPIDYDKLKTPLSPVGFSSGLPWSRTQTQDIEKRLSYGYGLNDFLVGGGTSSNYPVDEDAVVTPEPPIIYDKVITIVNDVTVVSLPERTPLLFSAIQLNKHIDSFSWDCSLTVLNEASYNLIKPTATATKDIEVTINGTVWQFFIGTTRKVKQFGSTAFVANGYSHSAKLQAPYAATNNFSNTSGALASQLIDEILSGTGFTASWSMPVNWPVAANGFTYQNKSPIDAVAQIASAAGAVIVPDLVNKTITIKPWCSDSAWLWSDLTELPVIDEALCFELTEQYTPQDQANAIYVSGDKSGAILKGKLPGSAGNNLLPSVNDVLITDNAVAAERARIELSKSGHKENVPVTTFVDSEKTLLMTGAMVTINMSDEPNWNGLINSVSISVENGGVQVNQQLNVIRHYEQA